MTLLNNFKDQAFSEKIKISEYFFQLIMDKREKRSFQGRNFEEI